MKDTGVPKSLVNEAPLKNALDNSDGRNVWHTLRDYGGICLLFTSCTLSLKRSNE